MNRRRAVDWTDGRGGRDDGQVPNPVPRGDAVPGKSTVRGERGIRATAAAVAARQRTLGNGPHTYTRRWLVHTAAAAAVAAAAAAAVAADTVIRTHFTAKRRKKSCPGRTAINSDDGDLGRATTTVTTATTIRAIKGTTVFRFARTRAIPQHGRDPVNDTENEDTVRRESPLFRERHNGHHTRRAEEHVLFSLLTSPLHRKARRR